ncbi:hypothetical protein [Streptomyces sp. NPDC002851]
MINAITRGTVPVAVVCGCLAVGTTAAVAGDAASPAPAAASAAAPDPSGWHEVGSGIERGVSGIAVAGSEPSATGAVELVVVRDNKDTGQSRIATVHLTPDNAVTRELAWRGPLPTDLEALDAVPGRPGRYIAVSSKGMTYDLDVTRTTATVRGAPVRLPDVRDGDNYESFALHRDASGRLFAVWATRGKSAEKSVVRAAPATAGRDGLRIADPTSRAEFAVPLPDEDEVRHISDLKVLGDGTLLVSSASDPNVNDGPFASAVYYAGRLTVDGTGDRDRNRNRNRNGDAVLDLKSAPELVPLHSFDKGDNRKIEAVAALPGGRGVWGTDDENFGGAVRVDPLPSTP